MRYDPRSKVATTTFEAELEALFTRFSQENRSNTPDFILVQYMVGCLKLWNDCVARREKWFGR